MGYMHPEIAMQEFDSLRLFVDDEVKLECQKLGQPSGLNVWENESSPEKSIGRITWCHI